MKRSLLLLTAAVSVVSIVSATFIFNKTGVISALGTIEEVWYHYAQVEPTYESHGSKEFWTSSSDNCQSHQFVAPQGVTCVEGDFSTSPYFASLDENDDRYLIPYKELTKDEFLEKIANVPTPTYTDVELVYIHNNDPQNYHNYTVLDTAANNWSNVKKKWDTTIWSAALVNALFNVPIISNIHIIEAYWGYNIKYHGDSSDQYGPTASDVDSKINKYLYTFKAVTDNSSIDPSGDLLVTHGDYTFTWSTNI